MALTLVVFTAGDGLAQSTPGFRLLEPRGPYDVGLRVVNQYDTSRAYSETAASASDAAGGSGARPLQTLVWYPARQNTGVPEKYSDYIDLEQTETSFEKPVPITGMEADHLASMPAATRAQTMWAARDAAALSGRFPLIAYAPSFSSVPWENADLCEYLASFGYVVIAVPALGEHRESTHDVAGTNAQARDLMFSISFGSTLGDVDMSKVAAIGYSWGGIANLFAAAEDPRIKALVALDGSMRYFPGVVAAAGYVHPDRMRIPLLYFAGQHSLEDQDLVQNTFHDPGPNVLNAWTHGDLFDIAMLGLIHPQFSSKAQRNELLWTQEFARLQEADYDRHDGVVGYAWMARYTRAFLDAYLKDDDSARTFLRNDPRENGVPDHTMAVRFRAAAP